MDRLSLNKEANRALDDEIEHGGGEVILDQRIRRLGSHHQKFVVLRHDEDPSKDVAFVGGIDLCHGRRDDAEHRGDPQSLPMAVGVRASPPWHDVQLEIRGPAVHVLDTVFRERWDDPNSPDEDHPIAWIHDKLHHTRLHADPLPPQLPAAAGVRAALRAEPAHLPGDPAALRLRPDGERSVARGYSKAIKRARRLIYLEDQYMWSAEVARLFADALTAHPELHLVVVVPRVPGPGGRLRRAAGAGRPLAGDRDVPERRGGPGARVRRGEPPGHAGLRAREGLRGRRRLGQRRQRQLQPALVDARQRALQRRPRHHPRPAGAARPGGKGDGARTFARTCGWRWPASTSTWPHDGSEDDAVLDPARFIDVLDERAEALDAWHEGGRRVPRPPGRLRPHRPESCRCSPGSGRPRSTGCSSTPTAAR